MTKIIALIVILVILAIIYKTVITAISKQKENQKSDYSNSYQAKPLLSAHEKDAIMKLNSVANELGLPLFTKVRLFDLIEPKKGVKNYKGAIWKIQAKHVDFVICNKEIEARLIIELDDSSHLRSDRQERDNFVDTVLSNTGYTILHMYDIDLEQVRKAISDLGLS